MADATLSTEFSRRAMLGGAAAVSTVATMATVAVAAPWRPPSQPSPTGGKSFIVPPPAGAAPLYAPIDAVGDARLAVLAGQYRRAVAALHGWIDAAEARDGVYAYVDPPWRDRYRALCARADGLVTEIAFIRPDSIYGLAVKLRAGVYYDPTGETPLDCDQRLLGPVLDDLDRMAEDALTVGL